jgi:hypothetical protein
MKVKILTCLEQELMFLHTCRRQLRAHHVVVRWLITSIYNAMEVIQEAAQKKKRRKGINKRLEGMACSAQKAKKGRSQRGLFLQPQATRFQSRAHGVILP